MKDRGDARFRRRFLADDDIAQFVDVFPSDFTLARLIAKEAAAERRFFSDWATPGPGRSSGSGGRRPPPLPASPAFHTPPVVGLFPEPSGSR